MVLFYAQVQVRVETNRAAQKDGKCLEAQGPTDSSNVDGGCGG